MAAIRLATVSATYSVPFRLRPTPVGPMTSAAGSVLAETGPDRASLATARGAPCGAG